MKLNKIFTIFLVVFQLIFLYATPIPSITVADALLIFIYPVLILYLMYSRKVSANIKGSPLVVLFIYIVFQFAFICLIKEMSYVNELFFRTGRYLFYLFTMIFIAPHFFDIKLGLKTLKYVSLISTLFLFLQLFMVKFAGVYIPGTIPGLPLIRTELIDFNQNIMQADYLIRPRSFFGEPAHYASYVALYLAIGLFSNKKKYKEYLPEVIITFGLLMSNSATGIIVGAIIWSSWIAYTLFVKCLPNKSIKYILFIMLLVPSVLIGVTSTSFFRIFIYRVFGSSGSGIGDATIGRIGNYQSIFSIDGLSMVEILFGRGMIENTVFLPALPKLFYYYGLVGMCLFFVVLLVMFCNSGLMQKITIFLIIILLTATEGIFGPFCLVYFSFCIVQRPTENCKQNVNNKIQS